MTTLSGTAVAKHPSGVLTTQPSMLSAVATEASVVAPIVTTGETIGGYRFEALPDGIALRDAGKKEVEAFVNHETSTVPFPYTASGPTAANSQNDFDNAQLSRLVLDTSNGGILGAGLVIESSDGFQRFCSNFLGTKAQGFNQDLLFTNEEAVDWVNRSGTSWPATEGSANARQSGVVVALDPKTGDQQAIWGMGRFNHENSLAVPGYGQPVLLSGDDTFVNSPSQSQLFSYVAKNSKAVWNDDGDLWAFVSDDPARQRYEDFIPGRHDGDRRSFHPGAKADRHRPERRRLGSDGGGCSRFAGWPLPAPADRWLVLTTARCDHGSQRRRTAMGAGALVAAEPCVPLRSP